jgi:ubiquinone/menaquinone biosynthesis C-methylase UbiE
MTEDFACMPTYLQGHHDSVLRSHRWRTAENSAGYLLPHLRPGMRVLDVGCGPGTITRDFAALVGRQGEVVGIDSSPDVVAQAAEGGDLPHVRFAVGDALHLVAGDDTYDVVHAHQVLQHLTDPVAALREMARVCRPGGLVAVRDAITRP